MRTTYLMLGASLITLAAGPCVPVKAQVPAEAGVHGGRVLRSGDRVFELVFMPKQLRVYPFATDGSALSANGMEGTLTVRAHGGEQARVPLQYVPAERAPSAAGERRDYLEALYDYRALTAGQSGLSAQINSGARVDRFAVGFSGFTRGARELVAGRTDDLDPATTNPFANPLRPGELPVTHPDSGPLVGGK